MRAALITEGKSDHGLVEVLRRLCLDLGVAEIEVEWANEKLAQPGATVEGKISALLEFDPEFDLLFIHRDADKAGVAARHEEIAAASTRCGDPLPFVTVIPVQEMEAWLLVDKQKIWDVVGNRGESPDLGLPKLSRVEHCGDPKETLRCALERAQTEGRKHKSKQKALAKGTFGLYRAHLLETLDIHGPVTQLDAWCRLVEQASAHCHKIEWMKQADS